ncbi:hypothetical protein CYY_008963 [Polysphondylium violaceum]|uniref:Protein-tyrosine-phosphatase n=1 Tax=Polysphondylium violaceum TaxID=133409 RepID=A0A8J4V0V6_9MYCE|nr:hypothetical protein CYY_008963 [Polysphondylium violaceum]
MDDVTRIFPGFYLGSVPAVNRSNLDDHGITHIVSVLNGFKPKWTNMYKYLHIDIIDTPSAELYQYFEKTFEFIEKGRQEGNVLVHCFAGISRSATVVVAYIMRKLKISLEDALGLVTDARPIVCPNEGFMKQLQKYEAEIKASTIKAKTTSQSKIYYYGPKNTTFDIVDDDEDEEDEDDDDFTDDDEDSEEEEKDKKKKPTTKGQATTTTTIQSLSEATVNISISDESSTNKTTETTATITTTTTTITAETRANEEEDEENENKEIIKINRELGQYRYCCRGCSKELFLDYDILDHEQGSGQTAFKWNKRDHHDQNKKDDIICTSFFLGEINFVLEQTYSGMDGKLNCDNCKEKLGSWSWSGEQCSCGAWIAPSFQIPKTRIDEKRVLN